MTVKVHEMLKLHWRRASRWGSAARETISASRVSLSYWAYQVCLLIPVWVTGAMSWLEAVVF